MTLSDALTSEQLDKLSKRMAVARAENDLAGAAGRLVQARKRLEWAREEEPGSVRQVEIWANRVADIEAAIETYNQRLAAAKVAAGIVS